MSKTILCNQRALNETLHEMRTIAAQYQWVKDRLGLTVIELAMPSKSNIDGPILPEKLVHLRWHIAMAGKHARAAQLSISTGLRAWSWLCSRGCSTSERRG